MSAVREWIALTFAPGLGVTTFWRLLDIFRTPAAVLHAKRGDLLQVPGVRETQIAGLCNCDSLLSLAGQELERLDRMGAHAIVHPDDDYPASLKDLPDPPPVLYLQGNKQLLHSQMVAVVGSRAATTYGRRVARNLSSGMAQWKITVLSGLALGIDSEAHMGALEANRPTIGVLGCGLDIVYPRQNKPLYERMKECGAIVSEYPLGTKPEPFRFPARNRIIAGLSQGIIVVEATKKSGSLITAQIGLDLNREIFAVPGQVDSVKSEGTHWLLQQGAKLVSGVDDIVSEFYAPLAGPNITSADEDSFSESYDSEDAELAAVLATLETYPISRDELILKSNVSPGRVSEMLLLLELDGKLEILPGNLVRKI